MDDAWLWLKRGVDWLDYRSPRGWGGYVAPDDRLVLPPPEDPVAEVTALASQGEGQHLEYKSRLPPSGNATTRREREAKRTALKDIVAFANGGGGTILYGVRDDGVIVGLDEPVGKARDRLTDFVRGRVFPSLPHHISQRVVDGKLVLMLEVEPTERTLYSLLIDVDRPEYYIRRDATTYPARADEIASVLSARS
jgi:predicted HTH transcriptional regulator